MRWLVLYDFLFSRKTTDLLIPIGAGDKMPTLPCVSALLNNTRSSGKDIFAAFLPGNRKVNKKSRRPSTARDTHSQLSR